MISRPPGMKIRQYMEGILLVPRFYLLSRVTFSTPTAVCSNNGNHSDPRPYVRQLRGDSGGRMSYSPMLTLHISGGILGLLSGAAALAFRKGSPRHVLAGRIFVASMLTMGVAAVYVAAVKHQSNNIGGGILTVYLIGTAWLTVRRRAGETSWFDWIALLIPLAIGILGWKNGLDALRS